MEKYGNSFVSVMNIVKGKVVISERQVVREDKTLVQDPQLCRGRIMSLLEGCDFFKGIAEAFGKKQNK